VRIGLRALFAEEGVGEFVGVAGLVGEVLGHVVGALGDDLDEGGGVGAGFEAGVELGGEGLPEVGGGFSGVALVVDEGEFLGFGGDEDEDAVALGGLVHAEAGEGFPGGGEGVVGGLVGDVNAEFAAGFLLQGLDGGGDFVVVDFEEEFLGVHGVLPVATGAAAAAAAAAAGEGGAAAVPTAAAAAAAAPTGAGVPPGGGGIAGEGVAAGGAEDDAALDLAQPLYEGPDKQENDEEDKEGAEEAGSGVLFLLAQGFAGAGVFALGGGDHAGDGVGEAGGVVAGAEVGF
jgi:hypothetical protein